MSICVGSADVITFPSNFCPHLNIPGSFFHPYYIRFFAGKIRQSVFCYRYGLSFFNNCLSEETKTVGRNIYDNTFEELSCVLINIELEFGKTLVTSRFSFLLFQGCPSILVALFVFASTPLIRPE